MNHSKWFLFARIEDHIPQAANLEDFFAGASSVLGIQIKHGHGLQKACYSHRLHGNWVSLLTEIVMSAPQQVRDALAANYVDFIKTKRQEQSWSYLFYRFCTPLQYEAQDVWKAEKEGVLYYAGKIPSLASHCFGDLIYGKIDCHSKPVRSKMIAFMYGCKRMGIDTGLRRAVCYLLHNLQIDYIIAFHMICGKNSAVLQERASAILGEIPSKRRVEADPSRIAHEATLVCLRNGYDNYEYARFIAAPLLTSLYRLVFQWVYYRMVGQSIPDMKKVAKIVYDFDKITLYFHKWMFRDALKLRLFKYQECFVTHIALLYAYIDFFENEQDLIKSIKERVKDKKVLQVYLMWAEADLKNPPTYSEMLKR